MAYAENVLIGHVYSGVNDKREYVKCGFCSDFYLKGNSCIHAFQSLQIPYSQILPVVRPL